jgi:hypothetical protein
MMSSNPASPPWSDRFEPDYLIDLSGLGDRNQPESVIVFTSIRSTIFVVIVVGHFKMPSA